MIAKPIKGVIKIFDGKPNTSGRQVALQTKQHHRPVRKHVEADGGEEARDDLMAVLDFFLPSSMTVSPFTVRASFRIQIRANLSGG